MHLEYSVVPPPSLRIRGESYIGSKYPPCDAAFESDALLESELARAAEIPVSTVPPMRYMYTHNNNIIMLLYKQVNFQD